MSVRFRDVSGDKIEPGDWISQAAGYSSAPYSDRPSVNKTDIPFYYKVNRVEAVEGYDRTFLLILQSGIEAIIVHSAMNYTILKESK
jgi:hypothetical protein